MFCHGNAGNISHRVGVAQILHNLKLNVLIFDYRGYGRSQGKPSESGLYRDGQAAYNYLVQQKGISPNKIIIFGKSLGSAVAVDLAHSVSAGALIIEGGFTSALEMRKKLFPGFPVDWLIAIRSDSLSKIKQIAMPKLIIHSIDDEIVPFEMGQRLFAATQQPKEFYQMHGGHNEAMLLAADRYTQRIEQFLSQYLR